MHNDIILISAGVDSYASAGGLSRYALTVAVIEKCADVASGTSKANSGIIHSRYESPTDTVMAELCIEGAHALPALVQVLCKRQIQHTFS